MASRSSPTTRRSRMPARSSTTMSLFRNGERGPPAWMSQRAIASVSSLREERHPAHPVGIDRLDARDADAPRRPGDVERIGTADGERPQPAEHIVRLVAIVLPLTEALGVAR